MEASLSDPISYADAGVDIQAGNQLVQSIGEAVSRTHRPGVGPGAGHGHTGSAAPGGASRGPRTGRCGRRPRSTGAGPHRPLVSGATEAVTAGGGPGGSGRGRFSPHARRRRTARADRRAAMTEPGF